MNPRHAILATFFFVLSLPCGARPGLAGDAGGDRWEPAKTRALVVGVLRWTSTSLRPFKPRNRRDVRFVELLKTRGVPADQLTYLQDTQATLAAIQAAFAKTLESSRPGETLLLYYCGHGTTSDQGTGYYAPYDAGKSWSSYWSFPSITKAIAADFRGKRVLIAADCCHSGAMIEQVQKKTRAHDYAVLSSVVAESSSTGNWTFTQSLIDGFSGASFVDQDHDGWVTLGDIARHSEQQMADFEDQPASNYLSPGFPASTMVASVMGPRTVPPVGDAIEVLDHGQWWRARIAGTDPTRIKVHWMQLGWDDEKDEQWVDRSLTRKVAKTTHAVGRSVEVLSEGEWYPARVLALQGALHHIHYEGYEASDDEWVTGNRVRIPGVGASSTQVRKKMP